MVDEKEIVSKIEEFLVSSANSLNSNCLLVDSRGYFFLFEDDENKCEYFEDTHSLGEHFPHILDSMLTSWQRLFKSAIYEAVEDARKAFFDKYPNAIIAVYPNGEIFVTYSGDWSNSNRVAGLYELFEEVINGQN